MLLKAERKTSWVRSSLSYQSWTMPSMRWKTSLPYALISCSTASAADEGSTRVSLSERYLDRYRSLRFRCMKTIIVTAGNTDTCGEIRKRTELVRCPYTWCYEISVPEIKSNSYPFIPHFFRQSASSGV